MKYKPKYKKSEEIQCWTCKHKTPVDIFGNEICKNIKSGVIFVEHNDLGVCDLWERKR